MTYHHALKDIGLVVDVMEDIFPENIQCPQWYHKSTDTHPQPVRKRRHSQRDDKDRCDARHKHDEAFGSEEVKE